LPASCVATSDLRSAADEDARIRADIKTEFTRAGSEVRFLDGQGHDVDPAAFGDDFLDGSSGKDRGDGGPQAAGDVCISIEDPTNCEITG
jgi:hypothetical protein